MKDATARKIIEAALGRMEEVLGRPLPRDPRRLTREAAAEMDKKNPDYVRMADVGLVLGFWDEMLHALRKRPEPTAEELVKYFAQLRSTDLAGFARDVLRGQLRKLPPSPKGIKPSLKPEQQQQVVAEVNRLVRTRKLNRKSIYREVAQKYGVHWRTIQNLCLKGPKLEGR